MGQDLMHRHTANCQYYSNQNWLYPFRNQVQRLEVAAGSTFIVEYNYKNVGNAAGK